MKKSANSTRYAALDRLNSGKKAKGKKRPKPKKDGGNAPRDFA